METGNFGKILPILLQVLIPVITGVAGYFAGVLLERRKNKLETITWQRQLLNQLCGIEEEIKKNRLVLNRINSDWEKASHKEEASYTTTVRDAYLSKLGDIPLTEAKTAIEWIGWSYSSFEDFCKLFNQFWSQYHREGISGSSEERLRIKKMQDKANICLKKAEAGLRGIQGIISQLEEALQK